MHTCLHVHIQPASVNARHFAHIASFCVRSNGAVCSYLAHESSEDDDSGDDDDDDDA